VYRAYIKHRWIVKHIYAHHECHPTSRVNEGVKQYHLWGKVGKDCRAWRGFSVNILIGVIIPLLCVIILVVLAWLSSRGWFAPDPQT
jgi:hypothetical protein